MYRLLFRVHCTHHNRDGHHTNTVFIVHCLSCSPFFWCERYKYKGSLSPAGRGRTRLMCTKYHIIKLDSGSLQIDVIMNTNSQINPQAKINVEINVSDEMFQCA